MEKVSKFSGKRKLIVFKSCNVEDCFNTSLNHPELSFHAVPPPNRDWIRITSNENEAKMIDVRDLWIEGLKIRKNLKDMRVCSTQFLQNDYVIPEFSTECDIKRRKLKKCVIPSQNLPRSDNENTQYQVVLKSIYKTPASRGSTSPFLKVNASNTITTPPINNFTSPGTNGSTSKFQENEILEGRDSIKRNLHSLFNVVDEILCDDGDCREVFSPKTQNIHLDMEEEVQKIDKGVQVKMENSDVPRIKNYMDMSIQVTSGDFYVPFSSRIQTDHDLSIMCGIRSFHILNKLESLIFEYYPERKKHEMSVRDRILLTTMKLKNDLKFSVLTIVFHCIAESTCRTIFIDTLQKLAKVLRCAIQWVPREEIRRNMPSCFKNFENTICVVDCTEFKIQTPKCLACRLKVYSQYKTHFTVKYMTAVSPAGLLMYISEGYGGRAPDHAIFEDSNIISRLQMGDAVMADKGFRIENICNKYGVQLFRPPFLEKKKQFSGEEASFNRRIAAARVHVERMNQRIEIFDVLRNEISWNLLNHINDIVIVCSGLANLGTPILADDKF